MKSVKKIMALLAVIAFISVSLSSCHRYGCPGQGHQDVEVKQTENC